jgi:hypothetical protein
LYWSSSLEVVVRVLLAHGPSPACHGRATVNCVPASQDTNLHLGRHYCT